MTSEIEDTDAREQRERRRLSRLVEALPVFSGFISTEAHLSQCHPPSDETFLWALPFFAYSHESITQIVDLCDRAAAGERVQFERDYLESSSPALTPDAPQVFRRGLLTLAPLLSDQDRVEDIAVSLIDCETAGLLPRSEFARSRLADANARIDGMLSLAQTVIERSTLQSHSVDIAPPSQRERRDHLSNRLNTLASVIDIISNPDQADISVETLIDHCLADIPPSLRIHRLQFMSDGGPIPIYAVPVMTLLLAELIDNARRYGAWRDDQENTPSASRGRVSIQSETLDTPDGRISRLHWIEDSALEPASIQVPGFGFHVAERLFPDLTGGTAKRLMSLDGLSWTFDLPISKANKPTGFDTDRS